MSLPRVSIITAVYNPPRDAFVDTVASVVGQTFEDWEWILADDCSTDEWVRPRLRELAASDPRIRIVERTENGHIVAASNSALAEARGEFLALLDHDDVLELNALETCMDVIDEAAEDGEIIDYTYSDQDLMSASGKTWRAYLKPDWSPERLRHHMYTSHLAILRRAIVEEVGGFREGFEGSQDHDLVLRVTEKAHGVRHIPKILYHWRQVEGSVSADSDAKPYARTAGLRAVQEHLQRVGIDGSAVPGELPYLYNVERNPDTKTPTSIIIPTVGTSAVIFGQTRVLVTETVRSILETSDHEALEFVIVYDTPTPESVLNELRALNEEFAAPIRLIEFREPFNFSAKCNVGAVHAMGDVLIFLNDDMEAISHGVPENLIAPLREEGVGMTGAKLLFENGRIQHAGVLYGGGHVFHGYWRYSGDAKGSHGELTINRECSALTAACVAVKRETFDAVGGFNELLPGSYNDVDFSLKVRHLGLRLLWLHAVHLYHFESLSRDPLVLGFERKIIEKRWENFEEVPERYSNLVRWDRGGRKVSKKSETG